MQRFVVSAAGIAGVAVSSSAIAEDITITMHLDFWIAEHGMAFSNASGGLFSSAVDGYIITSSSGSAMIMASSLTSWNSSIDPYTSGYRFVIDASVSGGVYDVNLTDEYGDGWQWNSVTGIDAFVVSGDVSGDTTIDFTSGSSRTGSVTVAPAPSGLALIGLAGILGRRKRA